MKVLIANGDAGPTILFSDREATKFLARKSSPKADWMDFSWEKMDFGVYLFEGEPDCQKDMLVGTLTFKTSLDVERLFK